MPIYSNMPERLYPRPTDVNAPLRSTIGIGPRGPKGHSITAEIVDTDPYGYFRVQFKDTNTDEVLVTTPNLDIGSRFYVCDKVFDVAQGDTCSANVVDFTTMQASSDRGAVRVGDLVFFRNSTSDTNFLTLDTFGIGIVTTVTNNIVTFVVHDVITAQLRNGAITSDMLADLCITTEKIANNAITNGKIANNSVTSDKLANGSVTSDKIGNGAIGTQKLADNSVTGPKIANNAVTGQKLSNNSVTESKISNGSITSSKLADESVTNSKLANGSVSSAKITNGAVTTEKLAKGAVETDKIKDGAVTPEKLSEGAINLPAPEFADPVEWSSSSDYDALTIVMHEGSSYTSRQFVPAGTRIDNDNYWVLTGNYNAQIERCRREAMQKTFYFSTVSEMQESTDLTNGCICITAGFHTINDGGGSTYYVSDNGTANNMNIIECQDSLNAELIAHDKINVLQLGATEHNSEDILQFALDNYNEITFEGTFYVEQALQLKHKVNLLGVGAELHTTSSIAIIEMDPTLDSGEQWALRDTYIANINFYGNGTQQYGEDATSYGLKIGIPSDTTTLINAPYFVIENCFFKYHLIGVYLEGYGHMIQSCESRNCKYGYYLIHPEQDYVLDSWANYCDTGLITNPIKEQYGHMFKIEGGSFQRCKVGIHLMNVNDAYVSTYHELNENADMICGDPNDESDYTMGCKNVTIDSKSSSSSSAIGLVHMYATVWADIRYVNYSSIAIPLIYVTGFCKYIKVNLCNELIRTIAPNPVEFLSNSKQTSIVFTDNVMTYSPAGIAFETATNSTQTPIRKTSIARSRFTDVVKDQYLNDAGRLIELPQSSHGHLEVVDSEGNSYLLISAHTAEHYRYTLMQMPLRLKISDTIYQITRDDDGFAKLDAV